MASPFAGAAIHWIAAFYPTRPSALGAAKGAKNTNIYFTPSRSDFVFARGSA
jgi:hypothetical protein